MAAVEAFGQPQNGREVSDDPAPAPAKPAILLVSPAGLGSAMIAGDERDGLDFVGLESSQIAILDQIIGMLVVSLVRDVHADVVEERGVLEPLAFAIRQAVHASGLFEQGDGQASDLACMLRKVVAPLRELEDAPPPDIGIAVGLRDL